jgi:hypothetical protein
LALAAVVTVLLVGPATAQAKIPIVGEVPVVGKVVEGAVGVGEALWNPAEAAMSAFLKILQAIFGGVEAKLITEVIAGLLAIPNFNSGHVAGLEHTTVAIAAGMLSAVLTLSILRYYLAGLTNSGSGGFEALQGLVRVTGAVGFIILWPGIFNALLEIPSAFNHALLGSTSVQHNVALLFDAALAIGAGAFYLSTGLGLIFVILIGFISATVFLVLLWMKVLLSVMLMFLYVSMPLCVVLWPVPELSWIAASAMKALGVAVIVPSVWAILFALSAAVNADVLTFASSHSIIDTVIIRPLAGITLMLMCITIPRFLMRTAMIGPQGQGGGWRVWRTVTFGMFAGRAAAGAGQAVASAAVEGHKGAARMIDRLPSQMRPPKAAGEGSVANRVVWGTSGFPEDEKRKGKDKAGAGQQQDWGAGEPVPKPTDASTGTGSEGASSKQASQPKSQAASGPQSEPASPGQGQTASGSHRAFVDAAGEWMHAQAHSAPSDAGEVASAMGKLPEKAQRQLAHIQATDKEKLRDSIASQLDNPEWTDDQQEALWTIGSSDGRSAEEGINRAIGRLDAAASPQASGAGTSTSGGAAAGTPGAAGGAAARPAHQPPSSSSPSPAGTAGGQGALAGGAGPPSGSRSLGADLREQPAPPAEKPTRPERDGGLVDPEPFRD